MKLGNCTLFQSALVLFLAGSSTAARDPSQDLPHVWITARREDAADAGRKVLDGSTQEKFDGIMDSIRPNAVIHLGPGVFVTNGVHLKNNWRILGSGKDKTIIRLANNAPTVDNPSAAAVLYNFDWEGFYHYIEISDLTLDCNRNNQALCSRGRPGVLNALTTATRNAKITRVRALGTWANFGEGFPFSVLSSGTKDGSNRVEIDSCENLNPMGPVTAIAAFDQTGTRISGFIRNCTVTNDPAGVGFGAGGWKNFEVSHNRTRNLGAAIVIDSHDYENVRIQHNEFRRNISYGLLYNGSGKYQDIVVENNFIEMAESARGGVMTNEATVSTQIRKNTIIQKSPTVSALSLGQKTKGIVSDNIISEKVRSHLNGADIVLRRNRDADGRVIAALSRHAN